MAPDGGQFKGMNGCSQWFLSRLAQEKPTAHRVTIRNLSENEHFSGVCMKRSTVKWCQRMMVIWGTMISRLYSSLVNES